MADTRLAEAIDAVVATLTAALASPTAVYDGPIISGDYAKSAVFVGYDGNPEGEFEAASLEQQWTGPGARVKDETLEIRCAAVAWSGDTAIKPLRDTVLSLFTAANAALRANPSQGLANPAVFNLEAGTLFQEPITNGLQARLPFTITAQVRI